MFGDHPVPSRTFLLQGGANIISDCSAHDVDYIRWVLQDEVESVYATGTSSDDELRERGVIDNATMVMKFMKGELNINLCMHALSIHIMCAYCIYAVLSYRRCIMHKSQTNMTVKKNQMLTSCEQFIIQKKN